MQVHIKAKHRENENTLEPEIVVIESEIIQSWKCEKCDFSSETETELKAHNDLKHMILIEEKEETFEIKLEVFALVLTDNVLETRKNIIETLNKQAEVEEVLKAFISKVESFSDVDGLAWNKADITFKSQKDLKYWKSAKLRRSIFSRCYLWETFKDFDGEYSREDLIKRRTARINEDLRMRGYVL